MPLVINIIIYKIIKRINSTLDNDAYFFIFWLLPVYSLNRFRSVTYFAKFRFFSDLVILRIKFPLNNY